MPLGPEDPLLRGTFGPSFVVACVRPEMQSYMGGHNVTS